MKEWIQIIAASFGSLGFAILFNIRGRKLFFTWISGILAWGSYLLAGKINPNPYFCGFVASSVITIFAECMARLHKTPVTVFLVPAVIPLLPGASLYRTMDYLLHRSWDDFAQESIYTVLFAASMAAGIMLTTVVFRMAWNRGHWQRRM